MSVADLKAQLAAIDMRSDQAEWDRVDALLEAEEAAPAHDAAAIAENPAAFPCTGEGFNSPHYTQHGMTLRDWFAGQALAGYFAHPSTPHMNATDAGAYCYAMADAMLSARAHISQAKGE